jgi:hypothetical protein
MVRRKSRMRDVSMEEFDAWSASVQNFKECSEVADEEGGPRLSFVPSPSCSRSRFCPTRSMPRRISRPPPPRSPLS